MKTYRDRFQQHPLQASLNNLWDSIQKVNLPKVSEKETGEDVATLRTRRDAFARYLRVVSFVAQTIDHTDATIWTPTAMSAVEAAITQLKSGLDQFTATKAISHLEAQADAALDAFRVAFIPRLAVASKQTADAFTRFCETAEKSIRSLNEIDHTIKDKEIEIDVAKKAFLEKLLEIQTQVDAFKTEFEAQKGRVDTLVTTQNQVFQTSQEERSKSFTQESENRKSTFEQWTKTADEKLAALLKATQTTADGHLAEMEKQKARAKEILGIVAASGVSGHYQKTADREYKSAEILRGAALLFFLLMIGIVVYVVLTLGGNEFRWQMGLFRVGVGLALLVPAYYCTRESAKHREAEKRNRRLQIELATIEPYLEKLNDDPAMLEILKQKADSYFMGQNHREPDDDVEGAKSSREMRRTEERVMDLLKTALTAAVKR